MCPGALHKMRPVCVEGTHWQLSIYMLRFGSPIIAKLWSKLINQADSVEVHFCAD